MEDNLKFLQNQIATLSDNGLFFLKTHPETVTNDDNGKKLINYLIEEEIIKRNININEIINN